MKWTLGERENGPIRRPLGRQSLDSGFRHNEKKKQMREKHPGYQYSSFLDLEKKWNIKTGTKSREQNDGFV